MPGVPVRIMGCLAVTATECITGPIEIWEPGAPWVYTEEASQVAARSIAWAAFTGVVVVDSMVEACIIETFANR